MANIIKVKHGSSVPNTTNLSSWEMGYNSANSSIYINNNGTIRKTGAINYTQSVLVDANATSVTLNPTNFHLTSDCFVYVDINSTDAATIKAFRKADLIYSSNTTNSIVLKVNGKVPAAVTIPFKITVVY